MALRHHRLSGRRAHSDTFVKRLHKITQAAISSSLAEIDKAMEDWIGSHEPGSPGSAWLLECVGPPEPRWLAAEESPAREWPYAEPVAKRIAHVADANHAIRFSREIDALNTARLLGIVGFYVPTQHEFIGEREAA